MNENFYVYVDIGEPRPFLAGQYIYSSETFTIAAQTYQQGSVFLYNPAYINHPKSFALDPINLPLQQDKVFYNAGTRTHTGIFGVFMDAGPDAWGRHILQSTRQPAPMTEVEIQLAGTGQGVGALLFGSSKKTCPKPIPIRPFASLEALHTAAERFMQHLPLTEEQKRLFEGAISLGGARPKTQIADTDGALWIAKFDRRDDPFSYAKTEFVAMRLAKLAGIDVADVEQTKTAVGDVCLVKRFDREANGLQHHIVSTRALFNAFEIADYHKKRLSYVSMARMFNTVCDSGENTKSEIYRRMLFNVAIGNTDDHLGNHSIIRRIDTGKTLISKAYDITPNHRLIGSHCIGLSDPERGMSTSTPSEINLANAALQMGLSQDEAKDIAKDILEVTAAMPAYLSDAGMPKNEIDRVMQLKHTTSLAKLAGVPVEKISVISAKIESVDDEISGAKEKPSGSSPGL